MKPIDWPRLRSNGYWIITAAFIGAGLAGANQLMFGAAAVLIVWRFDKNAR